MDLDLSESIVVNVGLGAAPIIEDGLPLLHLVGIESQRSVIFSINPFPIPL